MLQQIEIGSIGILQAQAWPTLLFAWQLWALLSEVLLAFTHLKVLLCIGKPIPAKELSNKRWTYFLYDLVSPWASLASTVAPYVLQTLAVRASNNSISTTSQGMPSSNISSSSSLLDTCKPSLPQLYPDATGCCTHHLMISPDQHASYYNYTITAAAAAVPLAPYTVSVLPPPNPAAAAAAAASGLAVQPSLQQLLLLFVGAHAALHVYYIVSWHTKHSQNVVQMSASSSMSSRTHQFDFWEVVWFFIGTSYDIATHVVMCGLLLQSMGSSSCSSLRV